MTRLVIHGWGQMGQAFASAQQRYDIVVNPTPFDIITSDDKLYNPDIIFPHDIHIMAVSTSGIDWFIEQVSDLKNIKLLVLTKGLINFQGRIDTLTNYLSHQISVSQFVFVSGPCLASDLLQQKKVTVNFSSSHDLTSIIKIFETDKYHIMPCVDITGCQWLAALKNIYAIVCANALKKSLTEGAVVFQQSLGEMQIFLKSFSGDPNTVLSLSGVGDLLVTTNGGRNGAFGSYLADGLSKDDILGGPMSGQTVEGLNVIDLFQQVPEQFTTISHSIPLYARLIALIQ